MAKELWVEKYSPERITDYVFKDVSQRKQVQNWITDGGIPIRCLVVLVQVKLHLQKY